MSKITISRNLLFEICYRLDFVGPPRLNQDRERTLVFKLRQRASIIRYVGWSVHLSVGPSVGLSNKIIHLYNDIYDQILGNENYSVTYFDSKSIGKLSPNPKGGCISLNPNISSH